MEAYSVELGDAFHSQIYESASNQRRDIEVINLGVGGYGTLQQYLAYREIGQLYSPDLVLLGFFVGNDVTNNSRELETLVHAGSQQGRHRPFLDDADPDIWSIAQVDIESARRMYAATRALHPLSRHSALVLATEMSLRQLARSDLTDRIKRAFRPDDKRELAVHGVNYCQEPPEFVMAWDNTKRILARLRDAVSADGSKLLVFSVPSIQEVNFEGTGDYAAVGANAEMLCLEQAPGHKRLAHVLGELRIDFVGLLPAFRRATHDQGAELFWHSDHHWNPEGHALAANNVVSALIEKRLLPPGTPAGNTGPSE